MDSNRVKEKKKKIQRSNIENNIDGIQKRLQRKILWRKKIYPQKNINILVKYTTSGLYKESDIQKMSKQSMN